MLKLPKPYTNWRNKAGNIVLHKNGKFLAFFETEKDFEPYLHKILFNAFILECEAVIAKSNKRPTGFERYYKSDRKF